MSKYVELNELQKFCREYTEVDAVGLILADRTDLLQTVQAIPPDKVKQAREEIEELATEQIQVYDEENPYISGVVEYVSLTEVKELLDKLIESEDKE